jgi:hypothetical protein
MLIDDIAVEANKLDTPGVGHTLAPINDAGWAARH